MNSEDNNMKIEQGDIVNSRKRGEILHYTISQVANLLEQEESSILYFTNVFDDILNIKISDKELIYTDKDIDKLEFLINLKNKGLTIKEIQKYCEELSLDNDEIVVPRENTSVSVSDIFETVSKSQAEQFEKLKEFFSNKIDENNELLSQKIVKLVEEQQQTQFSKIKEEILSDVKEFINSKFDGGNNSNASLGDEVYEKIDELISEKLSLEGNIKSEFEKLSEMYISREQNIIDEVKKFHQVIEQAYYIQQEVDKEKEKTGFLSRIFTNND